MAFEKPKPRRQPSEAQVAARERSFRIFRLRGLWWQAGLLTPENRDKSRAAIDADLEALGTESETLRWEGVRSAEGEHEEFEPEKGISI